MNQNNKDFLSEDDNTSVRDSEVSSDEDSVDVISTDCQEDHIEKGAFCDTNIVKNKFSIENILGLGKRDVACDSSQTEGNAQSENCRNESVRKVKCVKPTPISAATRSTGWDLVYLSIVCLL